jgi:hypothetical protein
MVRTLMSSMRAARVVLHPTASSVARIACFSISANVDPGMRTPACAVDESVAGKWSVLTTSLSHMTTARSTTFSSSRTLPGHVYSVSLVTASGARPRMSLPFSRA